MWALDEADHIADGGLDAGEDRSRDDGMADVEFEQARQFRDRLDVVIPKSVPGIEPHASTGDTAARLSNAAEFCDRLR